MSWRIDPELDEVFKDPEERRLAAVLSSVQAPAVEPDPAFRSQLRRQLMDEGWRRAEPRLPWWRRLTSPAPTAWGMAAVGTVLIAAAVFFSMHPGGGSQTVFVSYNLDLSQPVAAVRPLDVTFSQPMDRTSVEQAVQISPATAVTYQWVSDKEVRITPVAGSFAPNTQYTVGLTPNAARSQAGAVIAEAKPAVFTVAPAPTPAPTATPAPSPTPTPSPLTTQVLGPATSARPVWISPSTILYAGPSGQLLQQAVDAREPSVLLPQGVQALSARPDGAAALVLGAGLLSEVTLGTRAVAPIAEPAPVLAFGYDGAGKPWAVTAAVAGPAGGLATGPAHKLEAPATAAWLSPRAAALVYLSAQGLREVDLASGRETAWPAGGPSAILGWSPDEKHVLYAASDGLHAADPAGGGASRISSETGITSADWSSSGSIAFSAPSGLWTVAADGTGARRLAEGGAFQAVTWGQLANTLTYYLPGSVTPAGGALSLATLSSSAPAPVQLGADEAGRALAAFMQARVAGQAETARTSLDAAGQAAYGDGVSLVYSGDPKLQRWFTVASLPARGMVVEDVRLVLSDSRGRDVAQLDELITVARDPSGKVLVHGVRAGGPRPYGKGPEVIGVQASRTGVHVQFDSDLAAAAGDSVVLLDAAGKKVAAGALSGTREVVIAPPAPLAAGSYRISVLPALRDRDGRSPAAEFDLDLPLTE